jgi:hypothetical protein
VSVQVAWYRTRAPSTMSLWMRFRESKRNFEMYEPGALSKQISVLNYAHCALVIIPTCFLLAKITLVITLCE